MQSTLSRNKSLELVRSMVSEGMINPQDLRQFTPAVEDQFDPECVRQEMEAWFKNMGIENVTGKEFKLEKCTFTREELIEADANNEIVICSPPGLTADQVRKFTHINDSWAFHDPLITGTEESEEMWFKTPKTLVPDHMGLNGKEVRRKYESQNKLGMSLIRYMLFITRMRYLTGETPDVRYWIWLTKQRYDRSGWLIAGFDGNMNFNVHGWMGDFQASFCGSRHIEIPDRV
jgi:hypothetical protein